MTVPTALTGLVTTVISTRTVTVLVNDDSLAGGHTLVVTATTENGDAIAAANTANIALQLVAGANLVDETIAYVTGVAVTTTIANVARNLVTAGAAGVTAITRGSTTRRPAGGISGRTPTGRGAGTGTSTNTNTGGSGTPSSDTSGTTGTSSNSFDGNTPTDPFVEAPASGTSGTSGSDASKKIDDTDAGANSFDFGLDNFYDEYGDISL